MGTIIAGLVAQKAAGQVMGLIASKTQWGATTAAGAGIWAILPRVIDKDPEAIGQLVLILFGWLTALYGRWKAGKK